VLLQGVKILVARVPSDLSVARQKHCHQILIALVLDNLALAFRSWVADAADGSTVLLRRTLRFLLRLAKTSNKPSNAQLKNKSFCAADLLFILIKLSNFISCFCASFPLSGLRLARYAGLFVLTFEFPRRMICP
jgi:hypothetical protein